MAVFFYDLLRTTRRGRVALLRIAYALVLLVALYSLHSRRFSDAAFYSRGQWSQRAVDATAMAKFAEEFAGVFLLVQMAAVLLLTPVYTAGAIAEERQRGTLDSLLTTYLTPTQIVLGKLGARLAQLFGVLLTGLPVLALLPLWGGVDPRMVLAAFIETGLTMLTLGALGIWFSASGRTVRGSLAGTYAIMAAISLCPTCLCSSPYKLLI